METHHRNYLIETYETEVKRWRARIRRADGQKIKIDATDEEHDFVPAGGHAAMTAGAAINIAMDLINSGCMD